MQTDHFAKDETKPNSLLFETALTVIVLGIGIGFFADKINLASPNATPTQDYKGFTTVNIARTTR